MSLPEQGPLDVARAGDEDAFRQRAALILRDVLGYSGREAGEALDASPASVERALQRARAAAGGRLPERTQQATLRELGDAEIREVVDRFVSAFERGDVPEVFRRFGLPDALPA